MKHTFLSAAIALGGLAVAFGVADRPAESAPMPKATPASKPDNSVVKAVRVEIIDSSGKLQCVLTSEGGKPVAVVNDGGSARTIDLAKVARLAR